MLYVERLEFLVQYLEKEIRFKICEWSQKIKCYIGYESEDAQLGPGRHK